MNKWCYRLKESREKNNFTLKDVTKYINITQQSLIEYEKGNIYPKIDMLKELCELYNVTINYIVYGNSSGLSFENNIQKEIETLVSMYLFNKIKIENDNIIILDPEIMKYFYYFIKFIDENNKYDLNIVEKIIKAINRIK